MVFFIAESYLNKFTFCCSLHIVKQLKNDIFKKHVFYKQIKHLYIVNLFLYIFFFSISLSVFWLAFEKSQNK